MFKITKALEKKFEKSPLYSKDGKGLKAEVIAKFFMPIGSATWLITEAEKQEDGDYLFFGYCHIYEWEWGYVTLSELKNLRIKGIFSVELDRYLPNKCSVEDCVKSLGF